jgi:hypothetical protein
MKDSIAAAPFPGQNARTWGAALLIALSIMALPDLAREGHRQHGSPAAPPSSGFTASTAKPFYALMSDAMTQMDENMKRAPMT